MISRKQIACTIILAFLFLGKGNIQNQYYRLKKVVGFIYKERKKGMNINSIAYIRMDYLDKKVLVAHTAQVGQ